MIGILLANSSFISYDKDGITAMEGYVSYRLLANRLTPSDVFSFRVVLGRSDIPHSQRIQL